MSPLGVSFEFCFMLSLAKAGRVESTRQILQVTEADKWFAVASLFKNIHILWKTFMCITSYIEALLVPGDG